MKSRRGVVATLIAVPVLAFAAVYLLFFHNDAPKRLTLDQRGASSASGPLVGRWAVAPGSVAGYRVREKLARLPARSDAVGRSTAVTGGMTIEDKGGKPTVRDAAFDVDLRQLKSDEARRDNTIRTQGLQTNTFPKATWRSSFDIPVTADAAAGKPVNILTRGEITIHGITRTIAIPVDAQLTNGQIEVAGSLHFRMGDFKISAPNIGGFVTVDPCATMEFKIVLQRAGAQPGAAPPALELRLVSETGDARQAQSSSPPPCASSDE